MHSGFLSQLNCVGNESHSIRLSDLFLKWSKKFLVYAAYCANLSRASAVLQEKCEREEINQCVVVSAVDKGLKRCEYGVFCLLEI